MDTNDAFQIHLQKLPRQDERAIETIYTLGNGHFGVRASNPLQGKSSHYKGQPGMFVNGFYDLTELSYGENYSYYAQNSQTICQLPDPRYIIFELDGKRSDETPFDVKLVDKNLDMRTGVLLEIFDIKSPTNKQFRLTLQSFASHADKHVFVVKYSVSALNFTGALTVIKQANYIDQPIQNTGDDMRAAQPNMALDRTFIKSKIPTMLISTRKSQLALIVGQQALSDNPMQVAVIDDLPCHSKTFDLTQGLTQSFSFAYAVSYPHPLLQTTLVESEFAETTEKQLANKSFKDLLTASTAKVDQFWQNSDVDLQGDATLAQGIRFNLFHLYQAAGTDGQTSIAAKGLTGPGYEGHYFWDAEMFMLPFFIYTQPEMAKQLLIYRFNKLPQAQQRAREMAVQSGVMFPWRTINGEEASSYFPAGTAQVHINADIAYAVDTYVRVTGDMDFLTNYGYEMIVKTARFWLSYGHWATDSAHAGKFVIDDVTGPDEYTAMVNNNYYTNRMAQNNLSIAVKYSKLLQHNHPEKLVALDVTQDEIDHFDYAADEMYLPFDRTLKIKMQDDVSTSKPVWPIDTTPRNQFPLLLHFHPLTIYHYQVNKQADTVMTDFLFPKDQDAEQLQRDFSYYEAITVHDSSLSRAIFGILAHRLHRASDAYRYFMETVMMDLTNSQGNTADGVHAANMGSTWLSLIYGFAGLGLEKQTFNLSPELPEAWTSLRFRINFHGRNLEITITQSAVSVKLMAGRALKFYVHHQEVEVTKKSLVNVFLKTN
ncbi:glycoside hydrolase family 65 protein [Secundilactobacillus folii]|uniref:Glycoside hydrolase family 65 protein n=1 Tax=Secundilactobacillus folii TaxID=2678357 RepID=A0A7X2XXR3_9LACO|nr:glycosyl hydrolase family 65 protein [Secundilactobacillus folii]MTV83035.1 glycoside hydrolase family 65 protein [Secundilactobacillus folii]